MSAIGYMTNTRRRRTKPKNVHEHKGTLQDFIDLANGEAFLLGRKPLSEWENDSYSFNMFAIAADPRMLFRAWESLKGQAAGIDGVSPRDIARYVVYRKWLLKAKLYQHKAPAYRDTVFPDAPLELILMVNMACQPDHNYRANMTEFLGARPEFYGWLNERRSTYIANLGSIDGYQLARSIVKMKGGIPETYHSTFPLKFPTELEAHLRLAGQDHRQLKRVGEIVAEAISSIFVSIRKVNPRAMIHGITPLRLLKHEQYFGEPGIIEKHLVWEAMRWLSDLMVKIQGGGKGYRPDQIRTLGIPKGDGGQRMLSLPTAVDRIVAKSILLTIQPVFEQVFLPASVGCRNDKDRFDALAGLSRRYPSAQGKYILCADIRKAFDTVRHADLLATISKYFKNPDMLTLLERIVRREKSNTTGIGIPQGCPLSPLFLNILLHEHLDQPLQQAIGDELLYNRYVDDLSIFGFSTRQEGEELIHRLQDYLEPIGLELHTTPPKTQIANLAAGQLERAGTIRQNHYEHIFEIDRYLGLGMRGRSDGQLEFFLPASWPSRIENMFVEAEKNIALGGYVGQEGAHRHIFNATVSWFYAFAPAWNVAMEHEVVAKIITICNSVSRHTNYMTHGALVEVWRKAYCWWTGLLANRPCNMNATLGEGGANGHTSR